MKLTIDKYTQKKGLPASENKNVRGEIVIHADQVLEDSLAKRCAKAIINGATADILQCNGDKKVIIKDRAGFFSKNTQELLQNHPVKAEVMEEFAEVLASARNAIKNL